jgi:hypothetical protein
MVVLSRDINHWCLIFMFLSWSRESTMVFKYLIFHMFHIDDAENLSVHTFLSFLLFYLAWFIGLVYGTIYRKPSYFDGKNIMVPLVSCRFSQYFPLNQSNEWLLDAKPGHLPLDYAASGPLRWLLRRFHGRDRRLEPRNGSKDCSCFEQGIQWEIQRYCD